MNAQDLKNSILQLAVQGKLVEQRPEEGTAKEEVDAIRTKQKNMLLAKIIKKEKYDSKIEYNEYDLPDGWCYAKIGELTSLVTKQTGFDYSKSIKPNLVTTPIMGTIPLVQTKNFKGKKFDLNTDYYISQEIAERFPKILLDGKCLLLSIVGASIGNIGIFDENCLAMIGGAICKVKLISEELYEYLFYFLQSPIGQKEIKKNFKATAQGTITVQDVREIVVPIPPFLEQKRIVAKIEEILPYIDQYDEAYTKLEIFNKKFPEDMKKSILQLAMQGKLVEQRPEEGTADELYKQIITEKAQLIKEGNIKKEKPLPEITEDEIPFEIPSSWKWVRLNDLCEKIGSGSTPTGGRNVYKESGIKFLRSQNVYNDGLRYDGIAYISEEQNKPGSIVKAKDLLLNITGGSIGRCAIVPDDFDVANINQHVMIIRNVELELRFWIHTVIISTYIQSKIMNVQVGVSREGLSAEKLKAFLIPLPPLAEQKRIVAKIEELLPYCDQLVK